MFYCGIAGLAFGEVLLMQMDGTLAFVMAIFLEGIEIAKENKSDFAWNLKQNQLYKTNNLM